MMGFKIWRKDNQGWDLAFDTVFESREIVDSRIQELNAVWHDKVKYGELAFYPYRDDIKIARDGSIIDDNLQAIRSKRPRYRRKKRKFKTSTGASGSTNNLPLSHNRKSKRNRKKVEH